MIEEVARQEAGFFRRLGLDLPEHVIVDGEWEGLVSGKKTAVAPRVLAGGAGLPGHFKDTPRLPPGRRPVWPPGALRGAVATPGTTSRSPAGCTPSPSPPGKMGKGR